jgi:hypothetical protein
MKSKSWAMILFLAAVFVFAAPGLMKTMLFRQFAEITGVPVIAEQSSFHLLSGKLRLDKARWETNLDTTDSKSDSIPSTRSISIEKLWTQASLSELLHRRLTFPFAVADGMSYTLQDGDLRAIPELAHAPSRSLDLPSASPGISSEALMALDRTITTNLAQFTEQRGKFASMDQKLETIESQLLRRDNPLRGREVALEARQSLLVIEQMARDIAQEIERLTKAHQEGMAAAENAFLLEKSTYIAKHSELPMTSGDFEATSRQLIEKLIATLHDDVRPHYALAVRMIEASRGGEPAKSQRGTDYVFQDERKAPLVCADLRVRGSARHRENELAFSGQFRNLGSIGIDEMSRPNFEFAFQGHAQVGQPSLKMKATLSPDRQGFLLRSENRLETTFLSTLVCGAFEANIDLASPVISASWLMHQDEWRLDWKLDANQSQVAVQRAPDIKSVGGANKPAVCFEHPQASTFISASIQGTIDDGQFIQKSFKLDCPAQPKMAEELQSGYERLLVERKQETQAALVDNWTNRNQRASEEFANQKTQTQEWLAKLQKRLADDQNRIAVILEPQQDLRFAREPSGESMSR